MGVNLRGVFIGFIIVDLGFFWIFFGLGYFLEFGKMIVKEIFVN